MRLETIQGIETLISVSPTDINADGSFTIPDRVNAIKFDAFNEVRNIIRQVNASAVSELNDTLFSNCVKLTKVTLPALTTMRDYVFSDCAELTEVTLPALTTMGDSVFSGCAGLTEVTLPALTEIGDTFFYGCRMSINIILTDDLSLFNALKKRLPGDLQQNAFFISQVPLNRFISVNFDPNLLGMRTQCNTLVPLDVLGTILSFQDETTRKSIPRYRAFKRGLYATTIENPAQFDQITDEYVQYAQDYFNNAFIIRKLMRYLIIIEEIVPKVRRDTFFSGEQPTNKNKEIWQLRRAISKLIEYYKLEQGKTLKFDENDKTIIQSNKRLSAIIPQNDQQEIVSSPTIG